MDIPPDAQRRLAEEHIVWLTTVADSGVPAPNPVWFAPDGDDLVVFSDPTSRKVRNIEQRPAVTLHFNCSPEGDDVVVISGTATVTYDRPLSSLAAYVDKYTASITGPLATTTEELDKTYNAEIRIRPTRVRLTDGT